MNFFFLNENDSESDEEDIFSGNFVVEEDLALEGDEDCLNDSSSLDKIYHNGKLWADAPYGSTKLEP